MTFSLSTFIKNPHSLYPLLDRSHITFSPVSWDGESTINGDRFTCLLVYNRNTNKIDREIIFFCDQLHFFPAQPGEFSAAIEFRDDGLPLCMFASGNAKLLLKEDLQCNYIMEYWSVMGKLNWTIFAQCEVAISWRPCLLRLQGWS